MSKGLRYENKDHAVYKVIHNIPVSSYELLVTAGRMMRIMRALNKASKRLLKSGNRPDAYDVTSRYEIETWIGVGLLIGELKDRFMLSGDGLYSFTIAASKYEKVHGEMYIQPRGSLKWYGPFVDRPHHRIYKKTSIHIRDLRKGSMPKDWLAEKEIRQMCKFCDNLSVFHKRNIADALERLSGNEEYMHTLCCPDGYKNICVLGDNGTVMGQDL